MNPSASSSAPPPVITTHDLAVAAMKNPAVTVARKVNWQIHPGDFWVVGAPQNSGKSDLLMTLAGIMAPADGEYEFLGERMPIFEETRLPHRLKLGFVFDGGQLLGSLTLAENIALPLRYHSQLSEAAIAARVAALLELTELTPWAHSTPVNVARSWQQRAGLARALALTPEVLLLDNPLTGLDLRHVFWWLPLLRALAAGHELLAHRPVTLVATADDLRPWRGWARQVACLRDQELLLLGNWAAVDASPEPVVRELLRNPGAGT